MLGFQNSALGLDLEGNVVKMIMRSEILDEKTCPVCAEELDAIVLPADDPAWAGEMGMLAHPNCRMVLVPLFEGIEEVMTPTDPEIIERATRHFGMIMSEEWIARQRIPVRGRAALRNVPLTIDDLDDITEDDELILRLFGWTEED